MKTSLTSNEVQELKRLLAIVKQDGGWLPDEESMRLLHGTVSMWAPELVITRIVHWRREILLAVYGDEVERFRGHWHIPGGYNRFPEAGIQETCSRVALRELGVDVSYVYTYPNPHKWTNEEHPYGHPLSLYVKCVPLSEIVETDTMRFFCRENLPENLLPVHLQFIMESIF
ncbi:MAG: hypothetical protein V1489_00050 [Candidatus Liptonbacteria bacterium]